MWAAFELVYPHVCLACERLIHSSAQMLCFGCEAEIRARHDDMGGVHPAEKLFWGRCAIEAATSLATFTKGGISQRLLHQLKYQGMRDLGVYLGQLLGEKIRLTGRFKGVEAVVPVPLARDKLKKRGYNQAECVARGVARELQVPVITQYLVKQRATASQTKKGRWERMLNSERVFAIKPNLTPPERHLLVIDDVITTGATLTACVNALSHAHKVSVASVAYQ